MKVEDYVSSGYLTPKELSNITFEHDNKIYQDIINESIKFVADDFMSFGVDCDFIINFFITKSSNILLKSSDEHFTFLISIESNSDDSFFHGEFVVAIPLIEGINIQSIVGTCFELAFTDDVSSLSNFDLLKNTLYPVLKPDLNNMYFNIADIQSINRSMRALFTVFKYENEYDKFFKNFRIPHSAHYPLLFFKVKFEVNGKPHIHMISNKFEIFITAKSIGVKKKDVNLPPKFIFTTMGDNLNFDNLVESIEKLLLPFFNKLNNDNYVSVHDFILLTHMKEC